jgi:hypothetical protein
MANTPPVFKSRLQNLHDDLPQILAAKNGEPLKLLLIVTVFKSWNELRSFCLDVELRRRASQLQWNV